MKKKNLFQLHEVQNEEFYGIFIIADTDNKNFNHRYFMFIQRKNIFAIISEKIHTYRKHFTCLHTLEYINTYILTQHIFD